MKTSNIIFVVIAVGALGLFVPIWLAIARNTDTVLAVAGLAVSALGRRGEPAPAETPNTNVRTELVSALPRFTDDFSLPASVEANRVVSVAAEVSGRIEEVLCRKGAACRAGELLIALNTDLLKAEYDSAAARARHAAVKHKRMSNLHKQGSVPDSELDQAEADLAATRAAAEAAKARLDRAKIVAPISGVLDQIPVEKGEYVQPGMTVARIVEVKVVKVVVQIPERDVQYMRAGSAADVLTSVRGRKVSLAGTVTYISELADPQTRSTRLEITVDNRDRLLHSGQIVRARLTRRILEDVIMIPLAAVIPLENSKAVYVINAETKGGETAERREVRLGLIKGRKVQVLSGLSAGDRLIVAGHRFVADGHTVNRNEE